MPFLNNPTIGPITIAGTDYAAKTKKFWCTDEDLAFGLGKFEITLADSDGTVASAFPAWPTESGLWKQVSITADGNTIFKGLTESIGFKISPRGGHDVIVSGYNLGSELLNMFITKDYSQMVGPRADIFLRDVLTNAQRTMQYITPASPVVSGGTPPSYPAANQTPGYIQQKYIHDIIREVLTTIGWSGNIDTAGNFNMFPSTYPANQGIGITKGAIQSVFPTDTGTIAVPANNNLKEGNTIRDLHVTKSYLEVRGGGSGYDPLWNGLSNNAANWGGTGISWALSGTDLPSVLGAFSLIGTVNNPHNGTDINATYTFNAATYGIKNDVDATNGYLNFLFNKKTGLHFWLKSNAIGGPVGGSPVTGFLIQFTDTNSNTATLAQQINLNGNNAWEEHTLPTPLPFYNAWAAGQNDPWNYAGTFNFSAITKMTVTFHPGGTTQGPSSVQINSVGLDNVYFVCQPFYTPILTANVSSAYGRRDQVHNAGSQYVNQIDLQAYGDTLAAKYKSPMLRNALTIVTDGSVVHLENKAGYSLQMEIPRWNYHSIDLGTAGLGGKTQYWRIISTRWEYDARTGFQQKTDVTPSSAV